MHETFEEGKMCQGCLHGQDCDGKESGFAVCVPGHVDGIPSIEEVNLLRLDPPQSKLLLLLHDESLKCFASAAHIHMLLPGSPEPTLTSMGKRTSTRAYYLSMGTYASSSLVMMVRYLCRSCVMPW